MAAKKKTKKVAPKTKNVYVAYNPDSIPSDVIVNTYSTPAKAFAYAKERADGEPTDSDDQPITGWDGEERLEVWQQGYSEPLLILYPTEIDT